MSLMAGTIGNKHYAVADRETFTMEAEAIPGYMVLAHWDQASEDSSNVMVIRRDQFDRALEAYLGVTSASQ